MNEPDGLRGFIEQAGWSDAAIEPLPGDASFRRYFRLRRDSGDTAMLMHAPPPHEDPKPFLDVANYLIEHGLRAPRIHSEHAKEGWVLLEDFGDERLRDRLDHHPTQEEPLYAAAIETLANLHTKPAGTFAPYDMATYLREADLFTEWFCPSASLTVDTDGWRGAWEAVMKPVIERQVPGVTVLRDYHAENIMLTGRGEQGLIDFQDALVGHPGYDLVSLLQDARRDVSPELERAMLDHYRATANVDSSFDADYACLGAQRNAKIVGIFTRLAERDGKPRYLDLIPRVWSLMERDLAHPALEPVARWFEDNVRMEIREAKGRLSA